MTEKNKPEGQSKNQETASPQEKTNNESYGVGLIVINTLILAFFAITVLVAANNQGFFDKYAKSEVAIEIVSQAQGAVLESEKATELVTPHISEKVKIHILYGDETGGAHYYNVKAPCKSIFPESWSPNKIIKATEKIAGNDNIEWKPRKNGNVFAQAMEDEILVRVIMDAERKFVKTSYPLNAGRTPCPKEENKAVNTPKETKYFKVLDAVDTKSKENFNH